MAFLPTVFGSDFDDAFDSFFPDRMVRNAMPANIMSTDVRDKGDNYELSMELPGFDKSDVNVQLKDGNLVVTANAKKESEDKDSQGKLLRRERFSGTRSRSFYVGEGFQPRDIHATFSNGVLTLTLPKKAPAKDEAETTVAIEG